MLCPFCGDRMADHLSGVPDLCHELAITHARWDVLTLSAGRGGEQGLPFAEAATTARELLADTVAYWAQQVAVARASLWDVPNTLGEVARWLRLRLDWLRALEAAGEAYSEVDRAVCRARAVIDRPTHRTSFPVGPCPEIRGADRRYCMGAVYAYVPVRVDVDAAVMRCREPECRRHREPWTTDMWREAGKRINRLKQQLAGRTLVSRPCGDDTGCGAVVWGA